MELVLLSFFVLVQGFLCPLCSSGPTYSRCGITNALKSVRIVSSVLWLKLAIINPCNQFALLLAAINCLVYFRLLLRKIPRSFSFNLDSGFPSIL